MSAVDEHSNNLNTENELTDDLVDNDFYCAKCYDTVNYFLSECEALTPRVKKFEKCYFKCKKFSQEIKNKYETLEFDYQEVKSQKEDLEERYNLLLNKLTFKSSANDAAVLPILTNKSTTEPSAKPAKRPREDTYECDESFEGNKLIQCSNSLTTKTIHLDMKLLTKQLFSSKSVDSQFFIDYLGKTLQKVATESSRRFLENNKRSSTQEMDEKLKRQFEVNEVTLRNEINELKTKLDQSNSECRAVNENLLVQEEKSASALQLIHSLEMKLVEKNEQLELVILEKNKEINAEKQRAEALTRDYESQLNELNSFISTSESIVENLMKEKNKSEGKYFELSKQLEELKESDLKYHEEKTTDVKQLNEKIAEIEHLKLEIQAALEKSSHLEQETKTMSTYSCQVNEQNESLASQVSSCQSQIAQLEQQVKDLTQTLEQSQQENNKAQEDNADTNNQYQSQINELTEKLANSEATTKSLEQQLETLDQLEQQVKDLTQNLERSQFENSKALEDHAESNSRINEYQTQINDMLEKLANSEAATKNLEEQIEALSVKNSGVNMQFQELSQQASNDAENFKSSQQETETKYQREINSLTEKIIQYETDLAALNELVNALREANGCLTQNLQTVSGGLRSQQTNDEQR